MIKVLLHNGTLFSCDKHILKGVFYTWFVLHIVFRFEAIYLTFFYHFVLFIARAQGTALIIIQLALMLSNLECLAKAHNTKKKYHTLKIIRARLYKARYIYPSSLNVAFCP